MLSGNLNPFSKLLFDVSSAAYVMSQQNCDLSRLTVDKSRIEPILPESEFQAFEQLVDDSRELGVSISAIHNGLLDNSPENFGQVNAEISKIEENDEAQATQALLQFVTDLGIKPEAMSSVTDHIAKIIQLQNQVNETATKLNESSRSFLTNHLKTTLPEDAYREVSVFDQIVSFINPNSNLSFYQLIPQKGAKVKARFTPKSAAAFTELNLLFRSLNDFGFKDLSVKQDERGRTVCEYDLPQNSGTLVTTNDFDRDWKAFLSSMKGEYKLALSKRYAADLGVLSVKFDQHSEMIKARIQKSLPAYGVSDNEVNKFLQLIENDTKAFYDVIQYLINQTIIPRNQMAIGNTAFVLDNLCSEKLDQLTSQELLKGMEGLQVKPKEPSTSQRTQINSKLSKLANAKRESDEFIPGINPEIKELLLLKPIGSVQ